MGGAAGSVMEDAELVWGCTGAVLVVSGDTPPAPWLRLSSHLEEVLPGAS